MSRIKDSQQRTKAYMIRSLTEGYNEVREPIRISNGISRCRRLRT